MARVERTARLSVIPRSNAMTHNIDEHPRVQRLVAEGKPFVRHGTNRRRRTAASALRVGGNILRWRKRAHETLVSAAGVREVYFPGMQKIPAVTGEGYASTRRRKGNPAGSIQRISCERMPRRGTVNAYLVRSPCGDIDLEQGDIGSMVPMQHTKFTAGCFSLFRCRPQASKKWMRDPPDRCLHHGCLRGNNPPCDREVGFADAALTHRIRERCGRTDAVSYTHLTLPTKRIV